MRLWHYKLIPVLPDKMLVSQWRECIAIKRQWEKGTLKHPLVKYVMNYSKFYFIYYVFDVVNEMEARHIRYNKKLFYEICSFDDTEPELLYPRILPTQFRYNEHNNRYLMQCYYNLEEKYDRGIMSTYDWNKINEVIDND